MNIMSNAFDFALPLGINAVGVYDVNTGDLAAVLGPDDAGVMVSYTIAQAASKAVSGDLDLDEEGSWMAPMDDETFNRLRAELTASQREDFR
jgi:hypothetical protein